LDSIGGLSTGNIVNCTLVELCKALSVKSVTVKVIFSVPTQLEFMGEMLTVLPKKSTLSAVFPVAEYSTASPSISLR